jgi:hypothetical protein
MSLPFTSQELAWIVPIVVIDLILRGIALWKAARNNQITWFTFLMLINTAGILPLIYIYFFQKKK